MSSGKGVTVSRHLQKSTVRSELLSIQSSNKDGVLHCSEAVAWARKHPRSALHSAIEWDNELAGDKYRLWQVRRLIELHITSTPSGPTIVSLSVDRKNGGGYRSVSDVASTPNLRDIMLQDALDELARVQKKYSRVEALSLVWKEADAVRHNRARVGGKTDARAA